MEDKPYEYRKGDIVRYIGGGKDGGAMVEVTADTKDGMTKVDFRLFKCGICSEPARTIELVARAEDRVDTK